MSALLTTHVETHLDALEGLLPLRADAQEGRRWVLPRVQELDERIAAHAAALMLFAVDLPQVIAPFAVEHPVACAFALHGTRPPGEPEPDPPLTLRARLATADEEPALAAELWAMSPSQQVHAALADLGRPADVMPLIRRFAAEDPRCAVSAGVAFSVLTGCRCDGRQRVVLPPADGHEPDDFEREFLAQAWLPDARSALSSWERLRPVLDHVSRINRGFIVDDATADVHPGVDRREAAAARLRFRRCGLA